MKATEPRIPTRVEQAQHRERAGNSRILLYPVRDEYHAYRRDAEELARVMGWIASYADTGEQIMVFSDCQLEEVLRRCVASGHRVAVLERI